MKHLIIILLLGALTITVVFFVVLTFVLSYMVIEVKRYEQSSLSDENSKTKLQAKTVAATPEPTPSQFSIKVNNLNSWSKKYNCPINYSTYFVAASDAYGLDYRLLPAIAFRESTCGKHMAGNNPFGFGYYKFNSIPESIEYVAQSISGGDTKDAKYYIKAQKDSAKILGIYNTVVPTYTQEVLKIMQEIGGAS